MERNVVCSNQAHIVLWDLKLNELEKETYGSIPWNDVMDNSTIRTGALLSCDVASFGGAEPFSEATEVEHYDFSNEISQCRD